MSLDRPWGCEEPVEAPRLVDVEPAIAAGFALCNFKSGRVRLTPNGRLHFDRQLLFLEINRSSVMSLTELRELIARHDWDLKRAERGQPSDDADQWRDIPFFTTP